MNYPINPFPMPSTGWTGSTTIYGTDPQVLQRLDLLESKVERLLGDSEQEKIEYPKRFLIRDVAAVADETIEELGEGVIFKDGWVAVEWYKIRDGVACYTSMDGLGKVIIQWLDEA